jgi:hypothetical protein
MKKYLIISVLLFAPFFAKAEVPSDVLLLDNGSGYNINGEQTAQCLMNNYCYDMQGVFAFIREVKNQLINLENRVSNLENNQIIMNEKQIVSGTAIVEQSKTAIPKEDIIGASYADSYFTYTFLGDKYIKDSINSLTINGKTYTDGLHEHYKTRASVLFGLELKPGTYPYTFTISNDSYEGIFTGDIQVVSAQD